METIFFVLLAIVIYTFVVYPLLVVTLSRVAPKRRRKEKDKTPLVSLIISAYNEERGIRDKIENSLALNYPADRLEIIVASDGSTDRTEEIVKGFEEKGVLLIRVEGRAGKTAAQNKAVEMAKGDIILFSDANGFYGSDAIREIVANFADPHVGGVCGRLVYSKSTRKEGSEEMTYWSIENVLKESESLLSSVLGANGSIYAVRRELYLPLRADMISDLVEPLKIVERGRDFVYEKRAISVEDIRSVSDGFAKAFGRKVRIQTRAVLGLMHCLGLLYFPRHGLVSFQFFSHKILRYLMPLVLPALFICNLVVVASSWVTALCAMGQLIFYASAAVGYVFEKVNKPKSRVFSMCWYLAWTHAAALVSFFRLISGKRIVVWDTAR